VDLGLRGKTALVAGGSSGLGLAVARELAGEGAHVAIGARDKDRLASAERALREVACGQVHLTSVDIRDPAAARRWVDDTASSLGALHIVVISGGSPPAGHPGQFALDEYQTAIGGVPIPSLALSGMGRAALARFAQALAAEVGRDGVTVNVLAPSATRTEMVLRAAARLSADPEVMGRHNALGRIARPEEFAAVAAFLASKRASFVTGQVYLIDGGASVMGPELAHFTTAPRDTYT
jgi:3-oxoacyl-[acyl-carrier protein] reductase